MIKVMKAIEYSEEQYLDELHRLHPHIHLTSPYCGLAKPCSYYCDVCDNKWTVIARNLIGSGKKKPTGCAVCSGKRIGPPPKYINSIWAHPIFSKAWEKYFDDEFMKSHTIQSSDYVDISCPDCGKNKHTKISNLYHRGFCCTCKSRSSYPNKFIYSVLDQLGVSFEAEYSDNWTDGRQYDIYNDVLSLIIENHGIQHYKDKVFKNRTLLEEQANDAYKYELAISHGIQHYVVLDCRFSEIEWIKNSIMNSSLPQLLHFSEGDIDWNKAEQDAVKNIVREVCEEWEKNQTYDYNSIGAKFHISGSSVQNYLVVGAKYGWCSYNSNWRDRSVYCFQFDKEWSRISDASRETGVCASDILYCCKKFNGYAGKHPETGEELIWCFAEEKETYIPRVNRARKPVTCLDTMKEYKSMSEAGRELGIHPRCIGANCRGEQMSASGYHFSLTDEITEEKIAFAKAHKPKVLKHFIYCVDTHTVYSSADKVRFEVGDWQVVQYIKGERGRAGKSGYDYKFLYDYTKDDGTIIPGATTLGLITEEEALAQLNTQQND